MFIKLNKRGVIGRVMATLPILVGVVFLITIFLLLVGLSSLFKPFNSGIEQVNVIPQNNLLLQTIVVNGQKTTVFDKIMSIYSKENVATDKSDISRFFLGFMKSKPKDTCFFFFNGKPVISNLIFQCKVVEEKGKALGEDYDTTGCYNSPVTGDSDKFYSLYGSDFNVVSFNLDGWKSQISYYYGECRA